MKPSSSWHFHQWRATPAINIQSAESSGQPVVRARLAEDSWKESSTCLPLGEFRPSRGVNSAQLPKDFEKEMRERVEIVVEGPSASVDAFVSRLPHALFLVASCAQWVEQELPMDEPVGAPLPRILHGRLTRTDD